MFNLFKKKEEPFKRWVRFYSIHPGVSEINPWISASKLKRKWRKDAHIRQAKYEESRCPAKKWFKMFGTYNDYRMKGGAEREIDPDSISGLFSHAVTCPAIAQVMDTGWVMVAPADILLKFDKGNPSFGWLSQMNFNTSDDYVKSHVAEQTEGMRDLLAPWKGETLPSVIKLEMPWRVMAHPDILFMQMPIPYYDEPRFTVPTGIVDPAFSYEINLQLFWHQLPRGEEDSEVVLVKAGTPLVQWVPLDRKTFDMKNWNVIQEDANEEDIANNAIMDYNRFQHFAETTTLKERIELNRNVVSLNKNKERFN